MYDCSAELHNKDIVDEAENLQWLIDNESAQPTYEPQMTPISS